MALTHTSCLCGTGAYRLWATVNNVDIVECVSCGVRRVESIDKERYESLYTSGAYHAEGSTDLPHESAGREPHKTRFESDYEVGRMRVRKLAQYKDSDKRGLVIDVGCANGAFMAAALDTGFRVAGVDLTKDAVQSPTLADATVCGELSRVGFQRRSADIITFNDSFEHFVDPLSALKAANGILKRDGILVIEIPDMGCDDARRLGAEFKHVKPHEHLWYFTAAQMRDLLESNGFTVVGIDVPVPGKVTVYASPAVTVNDIEVQGPPGVGDTLWTLHKLKHIYESESPCRVHYVVCSSGGDKLVGRARDFLLLCPYINSVGIRNLDGQPLPRDVGCSDPSMPVYELFPNEFLDPKTPPYDGGLIENWRPEIESDWWGDLFTIPEAALEQANLRMRKNPVYATIYMSSHIWNSIVSEPDWTPKHWAALLIKLSNAGIKSVILGASADKEYADDVAVAIVESGYSPAAIWINMIDRTPLPLAIALMHNAKITVGVANGLPMLPLYTGGQSIIFWPTRGIARTKAQFCKQFQSGWLPKHIRESGRYKDLVVGQFTVESLYDEIIRRVGRIQNAAN